MHAPPRTAKSIESRESKPTEREKENLIISGPS
jgi:hypothetical protein